MQHKEVVRALIIARQYMWHDRDCNAIENGRLRFTKECDCGFREQVKYIDDVIGEFKPDAKEGQQ